MAEEPFTDEELIAFMEEALPVPEMVRIEQELRRSEALRQRVSWLRTLPDVGSYSLGAIWRRHRVSCPSRGELGSYLLGALGGSEQDYIRFHLTVVGCRYCQAELEDLRQDWVNPRRQSLRRKVMESSAGRLPAGQ
jgi:hypothetical protein